MAYFLRTKAFLWAWAIGLWVLLAFSGGWSLYLHSAGLHSWPLPVPELLAGWAAFRVAGRALDPIGLSVFWLVAVPFCGVLWVGLLTITAPFFGSTRDRFPETLHRHAMAGMPLVVLGLLTAAAACREAWGAWWAPQLWGPWAGYPGLAWGWLGWAYLLFGALTLAAQARAYWISFDIKARRIPAHLLFNAAILAVAAAGLGALAELTLGALV